MVSAPSGFKLHYKVTVLNPLLVHHTIVIDETLSAVGGIRNSVTSCIFRLCFVTLLVLLMKQGLQVLYWKNV